MEIIFKTFLSPFHYLSPLMLLLTSETRFGNFLPLWRNFAKVFGHFSSLVNIWLNCAPALATFYATGQKFIVVNGQTIVRIILISGHTAVLTKSNLSLISSRRRKE